MAVDPNLHLNVADAILRASLVWDIPGQPSMDEAKKDALIEKLKRFNDGMWRQALVSAGAALAVVEKRRAD